jgi:hypothetical protein
MYVCHMRPLRRNRHRFAENQLDLFAWADARPATMLPLSLAARVVSRRYRMPPHLAAVIASAAGLGGGE